MRWTARALAGWSAGACAMLTGCSHSEQAPQTMVANVNAAAAEAQSNIDNYLAERRERPRPRALAPASGPGEAVAHYGELLDAGRYGAAWRMWQGGGRGAGVDEPGFARRYARLARVRIEAGVPAAARGDGVVVVPVVLHATLASGRRLATAGAISLRRDADDGWRIEAATV